MNPHVLFPLVLLALAYAVHRWVGRWQHKRKLHRMTERVNWQQTEEI